MDNNKKFRPTLNKDEKKILQILVAHHKAIVYSDKKGWIINMTITTDKMVHHICLDYTLVTSLRDKGLIKRELNAMGKPHYILTETNMYEDIITEMRVRKALGVEAPDDCSKSSTS